MVSHKRNWSDQEDQMLIDKVTQYTQEGKTQLEAFQDAAEEIGRTSAACGYRWNAKLRNYPKTELEQAKQDEEGMTTQFPVIGEESHKATPLQIAMQYLECLHEYDIHSLKDIKNLLELNKENEQLKQKLAYFEQAYANAFR